MDAVRTITTITTAATAVNTTVAPSAKENAAPGLRACTSQRKPPGSFTGGRCMMTMRAHSAQVWTTQVKTASQKAARPNGLDQPSHERQPSRKTTSLKANSLR